MAPGGGEAKLNEILEALAVLKIKMRVGFHATLDSLLASGVTDTDIAVISAYWSESLESRAEALRKAGNSVTWIKIKGVTAS